MSFVKISLTVLAMALGLVRADTVSAEPVKGYSESVKRKLEERLLTKVPDIESEISADEILGYQEAGVQNINTIKQLRTLGIKPKKIKKYAKGGIVETADMIQEEFKKGNLGQWEEIFEYYNIKHLSYYHSKVLLQLKKNKVKSEEPIYLFVLDSRFFDNLPADSDNVITGNHTQNSFLFYMMEEYFYKYNLMVLEEWPSMAEKVQKIKESQKDVRLFALSSDEGYKAFFGEELCNKNLELLKSTLWLGGDISLAKRYIETGIENYETLDYFNLLGITTEILQIYLEIGYKESARIINEHSQFIYPSRDMFNISLLIADREGIPQYEVYEQMIPKDVRKVLIANNISNPQRYSANVIRAVQKTSNGEVDRNKPNALVIVSKADDWDGAFLGFSENLVTHETNQRRCVFDVYTSAYNLFLFEAGSDREMAEIIHHVGKICGKIDVFHLAGHGGRYRFCFVYDDDPKNLTISDRELLRGIDKYFRPDSIVIDNQCSGCEGGFGNRNLATMLKEATGAKVYATPVISALEKIETDDNGLVLKPVFFKGELCEF